MNAKKDNQYYGKYFEYLVACILNKELPCLSAEQWGVAGEDGLAIEKEAHEVATFLGPHRCFHTGLHTAGPLRFVFSWQNGCGLNNPTIRTFLR